MSEPTPQPAAALEASIHDLAAVLRQADHLDPEAQQALADLVDALSKHLHTVPLPAAETAQLADSAAQVVRALQQKPPTGLLAGARERLEDAIAAAEEKAPVATGVAQRLLDVLANLGI